MGRFVIIFALVVAWIYTLISCLRAPRADVRTLPKVLWLLLIVLVVGVPLYWLLGRPVVGRERGTGGFGARRLPKAPDDDPEFLRRVAEEAWRERMKRRRGDREGPDGSGEPRFL